MRTITMLFLVAGAGCRVEEIGENCAQLLGCMYAIEPSKRSLYEQTYGEESSCWGDDKSAEGCELACADALVTANDAWPLVEACDLGDEYTAAEVFALVSDYDVTVTAVVGDVPCDDITGGDGGLEMEPRSGAAFNLEGRVSFDGMYSQAIEGVACELVWGGFECDPFEGVLGENRIEGTFAPDMVTTTIQLDADASDRDPETSETVDCTYHIELLGTPG